jgi:Pectate lyase superfamily protein
MKDRKVAKVGLVCGLSVAIAQALAIQASVMQRSAIAFEMPEDSGAVNAKTYGARGDGKTDDTAAIQQALESNARSVYLPNGTYLISDTLQWGRPGQKMRVLQGQSQSQTILRLKDGSPGFNRPGDRKPVVTTFEGPSTNQAFQISIFDLTVDAGVGNPGAVGIRFTSNNQGTVSNVTIQSGAGSGAVGLALTKQWPGPSFIKNVHIKGFNYGVRVAHPEFGIVFEHLFLENQAVVGLENIGNILSIRGLTSRNAVPVVRNIQDDRGFMAIVDGKLEGGSSTGAAIENQVGHLYARNIQTTGYQSAIRDSTSQDSPKSVPGNAVSEYVSGKVFNLFPSPSHSLALPIRETPSVAYPNPKDWANVTQYGATPRDDQDDTAAIQAAMNSGKPVVYFPQGRYVIRQTIRVGGNVELITGMQSALVVQPPLRMQPAPVFRFEEGQQSAVTLERVWGDYAPGGKFYWIEQASSKTLVLRNLVLNSAAAYRNTGFGPLFIEDVSAGDWVFKRQSVWARQLNPENLGRKMINQGGTLWILGLKTEKEGTAVETTEAGKTEILGGLLYPAMPRSRELPADQPAFINQESALSVVMGESSYGGGFYKTIVRETRGGTTRTLMNDGLPRRGGNANVIPLYAGYKDLGGVPTGKDQNRAALPAGLEQKKPLFRHNCGFLSGLLEKILVFLRLGLLMKK